MGFTAYKWGKAPGGDPDLRVLLIFIDGIGIACRNNDANPFLLASSDVFGNGSCEEISETIFDGRIVPTQTDLGVPGLPQSATGQTALITGINAAERLGRHLPGFPTKTLKGILDEANILKRFKEVGISCAYVNAYRPLYLMRLRSNVQSTMTYCALGSDQPLFLIDHINRGEALYQDFTNRTLIQMGYSVPLFSPSKAGRILARISANYRFVLYEYFITDIIGHAQDLERGIEEVTKLDEFLIALLKEVDLARTLVIATSDHGNFEDLSVRTHTRNPVPTILWGKRRDEAAARIDSLLDITPAIVNLFT